TLSCGVRNAMALKMAGITEVQFSMAQLFRWMALSASGKSSVQLTTRSRGGSKMPRVHASGYILVLASLAASFASADESDVLLSVPDEAAQKQTVQLIANLYKGEYEAAKTPEQKSELAKK